MERSVPLIEFHDEYSLKGGWASSVYLNGAEVMERFAMCGATGNLITYLTDVLHIATATAAKSLHIFHGVVTLLPLLGAFLADAYFGRFKMIIISSLIYFFGLVMLTLSVSIIPLEYRQLALFVSLYLVGIGYGGHKPSLQTFGADQFNEDNLKEKKAKSRFFNWWYFGTCIGSSIGMLIVFYIQESVGWVEGFAITVVAMGLGFVVFLLGRRLYRQHLPYGSPLTRIIQVFVAAIRKRRLCFSKDEYVEWNEEEEGNIQTLPRTNQFRCLDKATIIDDTDGKSVTKNAWRLCTVTQVEEVKLLLRLIPIWLSCLMYSVVLGQGSTFFIKQGSTMDTSFRNSFHIPPASLQIFTGLTSILFLPIYDKCFVPIARNFTGFRSGITILQRIGFGMFFSTISMVIAALVECTRIRIANENGLLDQPNKVVPMSVLWLLPQYVTLGVSNVFAAVGLQELFYDQMPNQIRSIGSAIQLSTYGIGSLLSVVVISTAQYLSSSTGEEWLIDNLNRAHLDYYYWLLVVLSTLGLCAFMGVEKCFVYKKVNGDYAFPNVRLQGVQVSYDTTSRL
ncbi:hypothetical protein ACHQM5_002921 [Ranunculus cassubicifolius]